MADDRLRDARAAARDLTDRRATSSEAGRFLGTAVTDLAVDG